MSRSQYPSGAWSQWTTPPVTGSFFAASVAIFASP